MRHIFPKPVFHVQFLFIYLVAALCLYECVGCMFLVVKQAIELGDPSFIIRHYFDNDYVDYGAGFSRTLFWSSLSGIPLLVIAPIAPSIRGRSLAAALLVCTVLSLLPPFGYQHFITGNMQQWMAIENASHIADRFLLNTFPTALVLLCYAHIAVDGAIAAYRRRFPPWP